LGARGVPLASNQINYSLLYRKQGSQATVDYCAANGITVLAYYPLAMGLLTDRWSRADPPPDRGLRRYFEGGPDGRGVEPLSQVLREVAEARQVRVATVALNWLISKGGDTRSVIPIIGATRPEHLDDAVAALGWRLSGAEMAALEAASDGLGFEFEGSGFKTSSSKFVGYGFEPWRLD
jgi:pyridoxine 4-dehydrogenase